MKLNSAGGFPLRRGTLHKIHLAVADRRNAQVSCAVRECGRRC